MSFFIFQFPPLNNGHRINSLLFHVTLTKATKSITELIPLNELSLFHVPFIEIGWYYVAGTTKNPPLPPRRSFRIECFSSFPRNNKQMVISWKQRLSYLFISHIEGRNFLQLINRPRNVDFERILRIELLLLILSLKCLSSSSAEMSFSSGNYWWTAKDSDKFLNQRGLTCFE